MGNVDIDQVTFWHALLVSTLLSTLNASALKHKVFEDTSIPNVTLPSSVRVLGERDLNNISN